MQHKISYVDYNSILIVNQVGKLKQVFTPFKVISNSIHQQLYIVEEVRSTVKDELVYIINGKAYYHHLFTIDIRF